MTAKRRSARPASRTPPLQPAATPERRGRGRRRAEEVRADVLRTVGEVLLTEGSAELTYERVARLAGVSKTTLYKWWPSIGALALDGYFHAVEPALAFADTGDIRADLIGQLRSFGHVMTETPGGRVLAELIGQSQTDAELARAYRRLYSSERRRLAAQRLEQAQRQGQLRVEVDVQVVIDQLWGAVYHRLLIPDEPVTDEFLLALVGNLLDGIATGAGSPAAQHRQPARSATPTAAADQARLSPAADPSAAQPAG